MIVFSVMPVRFDELPNSANAQDAFGFTHGVRLLLPFGVAWLSSLASITL
jgi:hypothetical protein